MSTARSDRGIVRSTAPAASPAALLRSALVLLLALALAGPAAAAEDTEELMDMSLEDLASLDVEVTSVSRKEQKISEAAAAIAVLTGEGIRRSGATSVPEALRLVPGVEVARIDSNSWAVSVRGFNSEFANKLLVLIDGRTVYTPLFAGVYWDTQDVVLEDVARIEVIRGPGATVWGANAVNGVINIITRSAEETQGAMVSVLGGVEEEVITGTMRYGGSIGDDVHYRVYGRYVQRDDFPEVTATEGVEDGPDEWDQLRTGFRLDSQASSVASTSAEMSQQITSVASAVEESSTNVRTVAAAIEEMSSNLNSVASNSESMTESVNSVAVSVEDMGRALVDVSGRSSEAAGIAERAAEVAHRTDETVGLLGSSALEIGNVVQMIDDIANQTNLLALDATIEAASAGDAGRGFAVVANEVKELAKQTSGATDEIRKKIEGMQSNTERSVAAIQEIVGIIGQINDISKNIADLVKQQQANAGEISQAVGTAADSARVINQNVKEASIGAREVAQNAEELAKGSNEISRLVVETSNGTRQVAEQINEITGVAKDTSAGAGQVDRASDAIATLARQLQEAVERFRI